MNDSNDKLYFDTVKKDRGTYFIEYKPPIPSYRYANLQLVFPNSAIPSFVAEAMEKELKLWIAQYPIPLMVSAFDSKGDLYNLLDVRESNFLMGYFDKSKKVILLFWHTLKDGELPDDALNPTHLKTVYADIPFATSQELQLKSKKRKKQIYIGWLIVFCWAVIVPVIVAFLDYVSPVWVQALILIYSLLKAIEKALELLGKTKKSRKQIEKEADDLKMRHHHYHCEQNPEGFNRLKLENFERWGREKIQEEAKSLKQKEKII